MAFRLALAALFVALFVGCPLEPTVAVRSGTVNNDDVEEPLAPRAKKYEHALEVSNEIVRKLMARDYPSIVRDNFDPGLRSQFDEAKLAASMAAIESKLGPITGYKPMQWGFTSRKENGRAILISTKILTHEKGSLNYHFVFADDGRYLRLVGIHSRARTAK